MSLPVALLLCAAASLAHHVHNAEYLEHYPNMPSWLSAHGVYAAWTAASAVGLAGYALLRAGYSLTGYGLMIAYGCYLLESVLHYALAPISAHTFTMNISIWLEAAAGAGLLFALALRRRA